MDNLPDFDEIYVLVERQRDVAIEIGEVKEKIRTEEATAVSLLTTDSKYFINNKPPSVALMERRWLATGIDGNLGKLRVQLDKKLAELEYLRNRLEIVKYQIDIWRTQQADKRKATY